MKFEQDNRNLGQNIRLYRIRAGLTIKDLCKRITREGGVEIKSGSIRNYEKGKEKIPAAALTVIATATRTSIEAFYEPVDVSILLDGSNKIHLLEAYSMIRCQSNRDAILHLTRKLARGNHA